MSREDMKLPEGKTCADCGHVERCTWLLAGSSPAHWTPQSTTCDWSPSRFMPATTPLQRSMEHFLRLARRGKPNTCASTGEEAARKLALAIIEYACGLDGEAAEGAAEFLKRAPLAPNLARELIDAGRAPATPHVTIGSYLRHAHECAQAALLLANKTGQDVTDIAYPAEKATRDAKYAFGKLAEKGGPRS